MWMRVSELQRASWKWWESIFEHLCYIKLGFLFPSVSVIVVKRKWLIIQFNHSVVFNFLRPHARLPCPSLTPGACPLSWWYHTTISSSVVPVSSHFQSFSASGSFPRSQFPGLISFRMDWFDLLAVQGNLKSLLQHHRSKASILWCSAFFIVQLLHPYMATGKTIALIRRAFVGKVMSLLFIYLFILILFYF